MKLIVPLITLTILLMASWSIIYEQWRYAEGMKYSIRLLIDKNRALEAKISREKPN